VKTILALPACGIGTIKKSKAALLETFALGGHGEIGELEIGPVKPDSRKAE
jgi:hypothetical protein